MSQQPIDPRLAKFQADKAKRKAEAVRKKAESEKLQAMRDRIKAANPTATPTIVEQVLAEHLRLQQAQVITVKGKQVQVFRA